MKELFRNFDFNEAPAEMITTVCGMELPGGRGLLSDRQLQHK